MMIVAISSQELMETQLIKAGCNPKKKTKIIKTLSDAIKKNELFFVQDKNFFSMMVIKNGKPYAVAFAKRNPNDHSNLDIAFAISSSRLAKKIMKKKKI